MIQVRKTIEKFSAKVIYGSIFFIDIYAPVKCLHIKRNTSKRTRIVLFLEKVDLTSSLLYSWDGCYRFTIEKHKEGSLFKSNFWS